MSDINCSVCGGAIDEYGNPKESEEMERLKEIAKAVAHIGVDFGYGVYKLEDKYIQMAREVLDEG